MIWAFKAIQASSFFYGNAYLCRSTILHTYIRATTTITMTMAGKSLVDLPISMCFHIDSVAVVLLFSRC